MPDYDVREYVLTLLGSFLHGSNKNERFNIWTGTGGNGKSKLIELFEKSIGDYNCKLPISLRAIPILLYASAKSGLILTACL